MGDLSVKRLRAVALIAAAEMKSEQTYRYVVELPPVLTKVEWQAKYGSIVEPTAALEPTQ